MSQAEHHFINQPLFSQRSLLIGSVGSVATFSLLTWLVFGSAIKPVDEGAIHTVRQWENAGWNSVMLFITFLGNYQFLVPANLLLIIFFIFRKKKQTALLVFVIAITALGLKLFLKDLFARPRPDNPIITGITNFSYPSGHALMSVAFYGLIILLHRDVFSNIFWRRFLCITCILLILLIGLSRLYLRVHYPSDVLAGYCLGIGWISVGLYIFNMRYQNLGL